MPIIGAFGNEDLMHSLLNYISFQVINANFATERYTKKLDGTKGRADILLSKNDISIIIEMKYNNNENKVKCKTKLWKKQADKALEQAKSYLKLIEESDTKIFIGCNITSEKKVFLSGEIIKGKNSKEFNYLSMSSKY